MIDGGDGVGLGVGDGDAVGASVGLGVTTMIATVGDGDAAEREFDSLPQNETENIPSLCAQRQPYPDLARAFGDAAGENTVDAGRREHQRHESKCLEQDQRKTSLGRRCGEQVVHCGYPYDRLIFVH